MAGQLFTYALVKALYDRRRDYIETFTPIVLSSLDETSAAEIADVARHILNRREVAMPIHVIERVLRSCVKSGLVEQRRIHKSAVGYRLTKKGAAVCCSLEDEEDVARRVQALVTDICVYASRNGDDYTPERAKSDLQRLIDENLETFTRYVNPRVPDVRVPQGGTDGIVLLRYIEHAKTEDPQQYATVRDMVLGSVITAVLRTPDAASLNEIARPLAGTVAYLDSNVLFSLLGMQSDHLAAAARELTALMKSEGFSLKVFDFVLDEARNVLVRYARAGGNLPGSHNAESVYVQLRLRGVTPSDAVERAANLKDELQEYGVVIESIRSFDLATYEPRIPEVFEGLVRAKAAGKPFPDMDAIDGAARVDMAAIELIAAKRGGRVSKLEDSRFLLLTRDRRLAAFNRNEMGHQVSGTTPEVLLDGVLTNLLWLKNPRLNVSLEAVIALHSNELLRYDALWVRFSEILARLRKENRLDAADASALLTEEAITAIMEESPDLEIDDVDEALVIEEARRFRQEFEGRIRDLEDRARDTEEFARAAQQEKIDALQRLKETERRDEREVSAREASLRGFIERESNRAGWRKAALIVLPGVLAIWAGAGWLAIGIDASTTLKTISGLVVALLSSGAGWVLLQYLATQYSVTARTRLLREHELS